MEQHINILLYKVPKLLEDSDKTKIWMSCITQKDNLVLQK